MVRTSGKRNNHTTAIVADLVDELATVGNEVFMIFRIDVNILLHGIALERKCRCQTILSEYFEYVCGVLIEELQICCNQTSLI